MAKDWNKERAEQLGMPFGTACNRLRKKVLFELLKRFGENTCHRCNKEIKSEESLSIEHKVAWLNNSPDLFWDINNIAFSHLNCNIAHAQRGNTRSRKYKDDETAWCCGCQDFFAKK